ncbi:MAG: T9SS type A sorting domain-containing protein [Bacteroidetes bacterium]|nr:T9SS type A sorting domain-containing protein [Bacteroidota bacterium]
MNKLKVTVGIVVLLITNSFFLKANDTIRVMHYNLMYYGKKVYDCDNINNNIDEKNENLAEIIQYVKPDIFSVNELDGEGAYPVSDDATYLLDNALNVDGVSYYKKAEFPGIYLVNTIFYNSNKLRVKEHYPLDVSYGGLDKIFNVYKFYYNAEDLEATNDTAYVYCLVAHLKAGSYSENETQRAYETSLIMDYFESIGEAGNYLILGDFNVYSPTETAFQNLINPDNSIFNFNDPANQIGEWSKNYSYRYYHTQSTHAYGECFSGGGMDDRFDFILASDYIIDGADHFTYVPDSYQTIGQDGSNYNGSLNTTSNSAVPNNIAQALYNMSDHLPVYLELAVDQNQGEPLGLTELLEEDIRIHYQNPASNKMNLTIEGMDRRNLSIQLYTVKGEKVFEKEFGLDIGHTNITLNIEDLNSGLYVLNISDHSKLFYSSKVVIQNGD